ncbi:unnamed protein product [Hymenolepis diminuta]|uniref:Uncharacterized protein n=1 Tax=Hymenolepis diminuta TaxID=6216 RepID=A0A0R3SKM7_HYMDI|nr:unnamed protein product [Hymenolepis diminuta]
MRLRLRLVKFLDFCGIYGLGEEGSRVTTASGEGAGRGRKWRKRRRKGREEEEEKNEGAGGGEKEVCEEGWEIGQDGEAEVAGGGEGGGEGGGGGGVATSSEISHTWAGPEVREQYWRAHLVWTLRNDGGGSGDSGSGSSSSSSEGSGEEAGRSGGDEGEGEVKFPTIRPQPPWIYRLQVNPQVGSITHDLVLSDLNAVSW